ncbi:apyrase-like [Rhodnius prolixus]
MYSNIEEGEMFMALKDWRKAIRTPPSYRVAKRTLKIQTQCLTVVAIISALFLLTTFRSSDSSNFNEISENDKLTSDLVNSDYLIPVKAIRPYNTTYPVTKPVATGDETIFKIGVISDMDHSSLSKHESNTWRSRYKKGTLTWNSKSQTVSVKWDEAEPKMLKSKYSYSGRGMELSELVTFDGKLLSADDRTGIIYVIENENVYPWVVLLDGPGKIGKGFKSEWATVKDEHLFVGSVGKEWTTPQGEFVNNNPMWVKKISRFGEVTDIPWRNNYIALRKPFGITFPGYMWHEAGVWSDIHKKWFFLPRRMSSYIYNEKTDEEMGTNKLLIASENFKYIKIVDIGSVIPTRGFSSFKFLPNSKDEIIVAIKSLEVGNLTETFIVAFTIKGQILLNDTKIENHKYEGFEFI